MARKVEVLITDDLDGSEADGTVTFALDGTEYDIDLSKTNAAQLREALVPYVQAARKPASATRQRTTRQRTSKSPAEAGPSSSEVRTWAREHGIELSARGRIPADVYVKFQDAQAG